MGENSTDNNLEFKSIEKQRNEYLIKAINNNNSSLNLLVNGFYCYESNFTEDYIQQVFDDPNININDIYKLIKQGEFKIQKNKNDVKLIFFYNKSERELNIEISSLFQTLNELKNKRKTKDIFKIIIIIMMILIIILNIFLFSLCIKNNNKINKIENNKVLNDEITEKINEIENNKITDINNKINEIENNIIKFIIIYYKFFITSSNWIS